MIRGYGRDFTLAFAAQFWFTVATTFWAQYARWIVFLGGTEKDVGWVIGAGSAAALLVRPWIAEAINRFGAKTMWSLGMGLLGAAALANLAINGLEPPIFFVQAVAVVGLAIVYAAGLTYITQIAPPEKRTEMIGAFGVAGFAGVLIGPFVGDLMLGGPHRGRERFAVLFLGVAVSLAFACLLVHQLRPPASANRRGSARLSAFTSVLRRHWPGAIVWVNFMFGVCMALPFRLLARYIDSAALGVVGVGGFFLAYAGVGILLRLTMRDLPERCGLSATVVFALTLYGAGVFCFILVDGLHPFRLLIPAILCGSAHAVMFHSMIALTIEPFPAELRGTGTVLALMMQDLGGMTCLPVLGQLAFWNFGYVFVTIGGGCFLCAAGYAWSVRKVRVAARSSSVKQAMRGTGSLSQAVGDRLKRIGEIPAA